jgi:fructose-bisphosphate aldolase class 1
VLAELLIPSSETVSAQLDELLQPGGESVGLAAKGAKWRGFANTVNKFSPVAKNATLGEQRFSAATR